MHCIRSVGKAMHETKMIWPNARIGVALSGGYDSFVLLKVLQIRQKILPFPIEIMAIHLNPGFSKDNHKVLLPWLLSHGIAAHIELRSDGLEAHSEENLKRSPCFRCAWLRRRRLFELAAKYHLTHLAFGHNADDLVSTFFLNLCRNGRVDGMEMNESFFKGTLKLIRPLLLVEKKYIISAAKQWQLPIIKNPCPSAGHTARAELEQVLSSFYKLSHESKHCIFNALTRWQLNNSSRLDDGENP
ncbi:MAG: tRNA 2-thiocytidine biosynthesis protein TtcA [Desulfovibrio sp.]|nr:tRNA 2-thiocytidine biosynthesis protein TtcA [Desulfovibrio sp.]